MNSAPWHILGTGAMGCLYAARLTEGNLPVELLLRESPTEPRIPVVVDDEGGSHQYLLPASGTGEAGPIRQLLVTTKAYDVVNAVAGVIHRLDGNSQVLLLANGMGFAEELARRFPQLNIYQGTSTDGAYRLAPHHIRHAGTGLIRLGRSGVTSPPGWFTAWQSALPASTWDPDIQRALWLKLAVNCAINPLTAIHRCRNGELQKDPALAAEVDALCAEIVRVCVAAGYSDLADSIPDNVSQVIADTAQNQSSMLQDVLSNRPTEIDHITGYLLQVARRHDIATPANDSVLLEIKKLGNRDQS